jgi:hypothetical protein
VNHFATHVHPELNLRVIVPDAAASDGSPDQSMQIDYRFAPSARRVSMRARNI